MFLKILPAAQNIMCENRIFLVFLEHNIISDKKDNECSAGMCARTFEYWHDVPALEDPLLCELAEGGFEEEEGGPTGEHEQQVGHEERTCMYRNNNLCSNEDFPRDSAISFFFFVLRKRILRFRFTFNDSLICASLAYLKKKICVANYAKSSNRLHAILAKVIHCY